MLFISLFSISSALLPGRNKVPGRIKQGRGWIQTAGLVFKPKRSILYFCYCDFISTIFFFLRISISWLTVPTCSCMLSTLPTRAFDVIIIVTSSSLRDILSVEAEGGSRRNAEVVVARSSVLVGFVLSVPRLSLEGEGASSLRRIRGCSPSLKSLGLLSNLSAEETQMLALAPKLDSADWPMKTSVLRQRKGSVRKQHLFSWAWQQGRGQRVGILQSEKQTER